MSLGQVERLEKQVREMRKMMKQALVSDAMQQHMSLDVADGER